MEADKNQFAVIFAPFQGQGEKGLAPLTSEIDKKLPAHLPSSDAKREKLAMRQANAAVALLRLNQPEKVWPLLKHSPDPRVRSYLVHRLAPLGADAGRDELSVTDAEAEIGYYQGEGLLLEDVLREQVLLALPSKIPCRDD